MAFNPKTWIIGDRWNLTSANDLETRIAAGLPIAPVIGSAKKGFVLVPAFQEAMNLTIPSAGTWEVRAQALAIANNDSTQHNGYCILNAFRPSYARSVLQTPNARGTGTTSLAVTTQAVGSAFFLWVKVPSSTITINPVGVSSTSNRIIFAPNAQVVRTDATNGQRLELWRGVVVSAGADTINITPSASVAALTTALVGMEISNPLTFPAAWVDVDAGGGIGNASSATVTYPSLTPTDPLIAATQPEGYIGFAVTPNTPASGSSSGFTYVNGVDWQLAYNMNLTAASAVQPTATQSVAGISNALGAILLSGGHVDYWNAYGQQQNDKGGTIGGYVTANANDVMRVYVNCGSPGQQMYYEGGGILVARRV